MASAAAAMRGHFERAESDGECVPFNFAPASPRDSVVYGAATPAMADETPTVASITEEMVMPWIKHMLQSGATRIVVLIDDNELEWYAEPGLLSMYSKHFSVAVNIPMNRWDSFELVLAQMRAAEAAGERIVLHCLHGEGRTGRVLAAWLMSRYSLSAEEATAEVLAHAATAGSKRAGNVDRLRNYVTAGYDSWRKDAVHRPA